MNCLEEKTLHDYCLKYVFDVERAFKEKIFFGVDADHVAFNVIFHEGLYQWNAVLSRERTSQGIKVIAGSKSLSVGE